jgi:hypothetical protein
MPIKQGGYTHAKADARRDRRRQEAEARQRTYDALPLAEKLKSMGAKHKARYEKQQAALAKKKQATPPPAPVAAAPAVEAKPKKNYQKPKKS